MDVSDVQLRFCDGFKGTLNAPSGAVPIGNEEGGLQPYNLLFGALGSCFFSTFLAIATKKRLTFSEALLTISGRKRDQVPLTLEDVKIRMTVTGASDEAGIRKSAELGAEYCSVHATISKVANIELIVDFE
jgi:putative redox protein